jgi:hypothetical protein
MKTAPLLLVLAAAVVSGCATTRHDSISPELISIYKKTVDYENGLPATWRTDTYDLELVGYAHRNQDRYRVIKQEWEKCVGKLKEAELSQGESMASTIYALQLRYGATYLSIALINKKPTIQESRKAMLEYVKRHPELRLTEIAQFYLARPEELSQAQRSAELTANGR